MVETVTRNINGDEGENQMEASLKGDLLHGAGAIAEYLGLDRRAVYHLVAKGYLPSFKMGESIYARKSTLMKWIAQQEAAAL